MNALLAVLFAAVVLGLGIAGAVMFLYWCDDTRRRRPPTYLRRRQLDDVTRNDRVGL